MDLRRIVQEMHYEFETDNRVGVYHPCSLDSSIDICFLSLCHLGVDLSSTGILSAKSLTWNKMDKAVKLMFCGPMPAAHICNTAGSITDSTLELSCVLASRCA